MDGNINTRVHVYVSACVRYHGFKFVFFHIHRLSSDPALYIRRSHGHMPFTAVCITLPPRKEKASGGSAKPDRDI